MTQRIRTRPRGHVDRAHVAHLAHVDRGRVSPAEARRGAAASWAVVLGLLTSTACGPLSSGGDCSTDDLPKDDPCHGKGCCDEVIIGPDGGVVDDESAADAGATTTRICGACNG